MCSSDLPARRKRLRPPTPLLRLTKPLLRPTPLPPKPLRLPKLRLLTPLLRPTPLLRLPTLLLLRPTPLLRLPTPLPLRLPKAKRSNRLPASSRYGKARPHRRAFFFCGTCLHSDTKKPRTWRGREFAGVHRPQAGLTPAAWAPFAPCCTS